MRRSLRPGRRNLRQSVVRALLVVVAVGGIMFLFVLPGRTWLAQSRAMSQAQRQSRLLVAENAALQERAAQLRSPAYVAQIAREQYGLVSPGETAYGIVPPLAQTTTTTPGR